MKQIGISILLGMLLLALAWYLWGPRFYVVDHPQVLYIGDSLCEATHDGKGASVPQIAGIWKDCVGGRMSVEYGSLPKGKTIIFYALGTNDAGDVPVDVYRDDLVAKLAASDASWLVCVLPDPLKPENAPYREAMQQKCPHTIEPRDHGYLYSALDGIHGSVADHRRYGEWLAGYVDALLAQKPWQLAQSEDRK